MRVLVADNNEFYLNALRDYIMMLENMDVVGAALSYEKILTFTRTQGVDLLIFEPAMLGSNKLEKIAQIRSQAPEIILIGITLLPPDSFCYITKMDVDEVVNKSQIVTDLLPIIDQIQSLKRRSS